MTHRIVVDASRAWIGRVETLERAARAGERVEAELVCVLPRFSRHIAQFTSKAARDGWRDERSRIRLAPAAGRLERAGIAFRTSWAFEDRGGRRSALKRYALPAGLLAAVLAATD